MLYLIGIIFMALETTIFIFKNSIAFDEWAKGFDSPDVEAMYKAS